MDSKYINIYLGDSSLFSLNIGKRITKKELHNREKGRFPVYSANIFVPFGWVNELPNYIDYSKDSVIWGIDGNWMARFLFNKDFFVPTDHCGILQSKNNLIDLKYLSYMMKNEGQKLGFSRTYRSSLENIKKICIPIPLLSNGSFDLVTQKKIAAKFEAFESFKNSINDYKITLSGSNLLISQKEKILYKEEELKSIGYFIKGNSKYTAKYCHEHKGEFPVYSANTKGDYTIGCIDNFDHDKECLRITTNGVYAGTVTHIQKQKFSINGDACIFVLKKESGINYKYLEYALRSIRIKYGFGWENKPKMNDLKSINIPIPMNKDGIYDLDMQEKISTRYQRIDSKRNETIDLLKRIINTQINIVE